MEITNEEWIKIENYWTEVFLSENYDQKQSIALGFYLRQTLQNAEPLLERSKEFLSTRYFDMDNVERDKMIMFIHMLIQNYDNLAAAHSILMYESSSFSGDVKE